MAKLTVITVVYNDVKNIDRTMRSVLDQTFESVEYIVIDGGSTDGTLSRIEVHADRLEHFLSEPDQGIYDAMNKGLVLATGDYVLFMNSGDELYDNRTVADVFAAAPSADIYYGETEMYNEQWESLGQRRHRVPESFNWESFKLGMSISHQAIYIKRILVSPYDLNYKYSSDIDWIIRAAKKASSIVNVHRYVAKYLVGGTSKQRHLASLKERFQIFTKYYGLVPNIFNHLLIALNLGVYYLRHGRSND